MSEGMTSEKNCVFCKRYTCIDSLLANRRGY